MHYGGAARPRELAQRNGNAVADATRFLRARQRTVAFARRTLRAAVRAKLVLGPLHQLHNNLLVALSILHLVPRRTGMQGDEVGRRVKRSVQRRGAWIERNSRRQGEMLESFFTKDGHSPVSP